MHTSLYWLGHFSHNLEIKRIDWSTEPVLTASERKIILKALQAWQLGETSDGRHLLRAAGKYAKRQKDTYYCQAVQLFIKEEQKHGNNLGTYLDRVHEPRLAKNWGDTLFRKVRYFNTNMELWTLTVLTVESAAQVFYQSLKDATNCPLLDQVCTDILIDEAYHINFQLERLAVIFSCKSRAGKTICLYMYKLFYFSSMAVIWLAYRQVFKAGGNGPAKYFKKIKLKFRRIMKQLKA